MKRNSLLCLLFITVLACATGASSALSLGVAPQIQATNSLMYHQAVDLGMKASFSITAVGDPPLSYQWRLNGTNLLSETNPTLTITSAKAFHEGDYSVVVSNAAGVDISEPARLWVVPKASKFVKGNYTNEAQLRLPYFYVLPPNYDSARSYPLVVNMHGSGIDETAMLYPNYGTDAMLNFAEFKVFASLGRDLTNHVVLVCPSRRKWDNTSWTGEYLRLIPGMVDQMTAQFSIDTNRVYGIGNSGGGAVWDVVGVKPSLFAGVVVLSGLGQGAGTSGPFRDVPLWTFVAKDDIAQTVRANVQMLRASGNNPIYTEYDTGGHGGGIVLGYATPASHDWLLAQRRGQPATGEPLLSVTHPSETSFTTTASALDVAGSAAALGRAITRVQWTNAVNRTGGLAAGTDSWKATGIPLAAGKTNVITIIATTTSWAPLLKGSTTFSQTLFVVSDALRASLTLHPSGAVLDWRGGVGPFRVQRTSALSFAIWTDVFTNASPPLTVELDGTSGFYRVVGR